MRFEILSEIFDIETFAKSSGIREIARLRRVYGRARWRKRKGMARILLSCIGMKLPESVVKSSKSNICSEITARNQHHAKITIEAFCGLRQE